MTSTTDRSAAPVTERRIHPRVASQLDVSIYAVGVPTQIDGVARDLGPGGICVETLSPLGIDYARRLTVVLDGQVQTLKVACRWQREAPGRHGILNGLQFIDVQEAQMQCLWRYVYSRAQELAQFVQSESALSGLSFDEAIELALHTRMIRLSDGDWVYRQGSDAALGGAAFVVFDGAVMLDAVNASATSVYETRLEPGDVFGGLPFLTGLPHPETAIALQDARVLEIDQFAYRHLLATRPAAAQRLTAALIRRYANRLAELVAAGNDLPRPGLHRFRLPVGAPGDPLADTQAETDA